MLVGCKLIEKILLQDLIFLCVTILYYICYFIKVTVNKLTIY